MMLYFTNPCSYIIVQQNVSMRACPGGGRAIIYQLGNQDNQITQLIMSNERHSQCARNRCKYSLLNVYLILNNSARFVLGNNINIAQKQGDVIQVRLLMQLLTCKKNLAMHIHAVLMRGQLGYIFDGDRWSQIANYVITN